MNEIRKMYENAKVKPICDGLDCLTCAERYKECAERMKQLLQEDNQ